MRLSLWKYGFFCATLAAGTAAAGTINLGWEQVPEATGYRVYFGTDAGSYTSFRSLGDTLSGSLDDLESCTRYYVAVKAFNAGGESGTYSNEVSGWPRPEIASYSPSAVEQGGQYTLDLVGSNFEPGAELVFTGQGMPTDLAGIPLIRVDAIQVVDCTRIQALITIEPTSAGFRAMEIGSFVVDFEVRNPDSVFGVAHGQLQVDFNQRRADLNRSDSGTRDRVDGKDLIWLAHAYGSSEGENLFNPDADLNGDGAVDGADLAFLATGFGGCWDGDGWNLGACP
ncbi:MAG: hypothetical protein GY716_18975 [bacterium]|nr:hypothetical protein [bacterium]